MRSEADAEFVSYVRSRQHALLRAAYLVCGDAHLAEDLLQEAFVKLALRWGRLKDENPDAYVRKILYRDAVSAWRRVRRERLGGLTLPEPRGTHDAGDPTPRDELLRYLHVLTPRQRAVVVLRFFEDRSERETAELLGVAPGTVKRATHEALGRLRARMPDLAVTGTEGP